MESTIENTMECTKKKKRNHGILILTATCLLVFVVGLILALVSDGFIGNIILLVGGVIELGAAFVVFKIAEHRERFTCPECGTKREHHRTYIKTTEKDSVVNHNHKTVYTHVYRDTYTCPECGNEMVNIVNKNGGYYSRLNDGNVVDNRIDYREF